MGFFSKLFKKKKFHDKPRMYIIVRGDLSETYRMVQGAHALAQFAMDHPEEFKQWNNEYLIFLKVFNKIALVDFIIKKLSKSYVPYSLFKEPDLDNQITAIALYNNGEVVEGLPMA